MGDISQKKSQASPIQKKREKNGDQGSWGDKREKICIEKDQSGVRNPIKNLGLIQICITDKVKSWIWIRSHKSPKSLNSSSKKGRYPPLKNARRKVKIWENSPSMTSPPPPRG